MTEHLSSGSYWMGAGMGFLIVGTVIVLTGDFNPIAALVLGSVALAYGFYREVDQ